MRKYFTEYKEHGIQFDDNNEKFIVGDKEFEELKEAKLYIDSLGGFDVFYTGLKVKKHSKLDILIQLVKELDLHYHYDFNEDLCLLNLYSNSNENELLYLDENSNFIEISKINEDIIIETHRLHLLQQLKKHLFSIVGVLDQIILPNDEKSSESIIEIIEEIENSK